MPTYEVPFGIGQSVYRVTCKEQYEDCGYCRGQRYLVSPYRNEPHLACPGCGGTGVRVKPLTEHVVDGPWQVGKITFYREDNLWYGISRTEKDANGNYRREDEDCTAGLLHTSWNDAQDHADKVNGKFVLAESEAAS